jgi:chromosome segregation ATPase
LEAGINRISRLEKEIVELRRAIATAQQENSTLRQTVTKKEEQIIAAKEEKKAQLSDDVERLKQSHLKLIELLQRREEEHAETQATGQQTHEGIQRITKELGECRDLLYDCRMSFKKYEKEVKEETARIVGEAVKHEDIERIVNDTVKTVVYSFVDEIIRPAQGNMDELRQEQHKICQTLYEMSHEREEFKSNTVALQQERAELLRNAEALQQERAEMQRNTEALQQERAELQSNAEALRQERTELNDQAEALQREKEVLQSETEILCRDREALCQNEQHFEAQKKQKEEELRGKEEEIGRMQAEITMEKETLTEERARIDHDRAEAQAVAADIEQARKQFDYYEKLFEGVQGDMGLDDQLTYRANLSRFESAYNDMELVLMYCNNAHEKKYVESLRDILAEIEGVAKRHTK